MLIKPVLKLRQKSIVQLPVTVLLLSLFASTLMLSGRGYAASVSVSATVLEQRVLFKQAMQALEERDPAKFDQLYARLSDYPLHRYLDYQRIRALMEELPDKEVVGLLNLFEKKYKDDTLTGYLTRFLQKKLIEKEDWPLFLGVSKSRLARDRQCARARAIAETKGLKVWQEPLLAYWSNTPLLPELCKETLDALYKQASPGIQAIWQRIYSSISKRKLDAARSMADALSTSDRKRVLAWVDKRETPAELLLSKKVAEDDLLNRRILLDLVVRWSWQEPEAAFDYWQKVHKNYSFFDDERYETTRELALRGAWRQLPDAHEWLYSFSAREDDLELMEWRVRTALRRQDWQALLKSLSELPQQEQEEDHWAYWEARAHYELGDVTKAREIYKELAQLATYHGFLAADRMGMQYRISDSGIDAEQAVIEKLAQNASLIRAREYLHTGLFSEGRREWSAGLKLLDRSEVAATALLASQWELPDRAIVSANMAKEKAALSMRFPIAYQDEVTQAASKYKLEPAIIYGVIRRESAFIEDIRSSAGAVGLMQLMPKTAKYVSGLMGRGDQPYKLTDAATSIDFGSYYFRHVLDKFEQHPALAASSYNAGPHRTKSWLPEDDAIPTDVWIDSIPFTETRRYVRAVLAYAVIFEWRMQGKVTRISKRIGDELVPQVSSDATESEQSG